MNATNSPTAMNDTKQTVIAQDPSPAESAIMRKPQSKKAVLKEQLAEEIRSRMEVIPDNPRGKGDVVTPYTESWKGLKAMRDEVEQIVPALCQATLTYRQIDAGISESAKEKALAEARRQMDEATSLDLPSPENLCDAHVLRLDADELGNFLREAIESSIADFVNGFFTALDALVDHSIAGLAVWTSPTTLQYSYVRQIVEQTVTDTETTTRRKASEASPERNVNRTETIVSGTSTHVFARYEHHVFDACETTIENSSVVVPAAVQAYIESVPEWMVSVHRIVDGTLARQEFTEKTVRTEPWSETTVVKETPVARDPALVIGDVVLLGWDADDINVELSRRQQAVDKKEAEGRSVFWAMATVLAGITSLTLFWHATSPILLCVAFASLMFVIPPCILHTTYGDTLDPRSRNTSHVRGALIVVCGLLAYGLLFAFGLSRWSVIGISAGLFAFVGVLAASMQLSESPVSAS